MVRRLRKEEDLDLEAAEFFVRGRMLAAGAQALEDFLAERLENESAPVCGRDHPSTAMRSDGRRGKTIRTILGTVRIERRRFVCPVCGEVRYPADERLGVADTGFSPGLRRLMARAGAYEPFAPASESLHLYAGVEVGPKDVERVAEETGRRAAVWMQEQGAEAALKAAVDQPTVEQAPETLYVSFDGTGAPMRASELEGVAGKNGKARSREVKLGCVFTQSGLDAKGQPVRDPDSTSYVGAIEASVDFGHRLVQEAKRRGSHQAGRVVVLTDGAAYNKSIVAEHFPQALHILDPFHAQEHLSEFTRGQKIELESAWHRKARRLLEQGHLAALLKTLGSALPRSGPRRKAGLAQIAYFRTNAPHMRYEHFRKQGLFVGSGVMEAGCRTIVGQRLKRSGMFWTRHGANALIALRCCILSGRFEDFWEHEAEKKAA